MERLFRDFYGEALRPDELARLARRTEGWAAGLQLFHLATRGKAAAERQRLLAGLGPSSRIMREYLARNVVEELPDDLREFLVGTCVLRRLTGSLCDRLLDRSGSRALLEELERRSVFTVAIDDEGTYRYHEVLRSHLEGMLVEAVGEPGARARAPGAAASCSRRTARSPRPSRPTAGPRTGPPSIACSTGTASAWRPAQGAWMDTLPPALLVQDPWLILATARRHRAEGRWAQARRGLRAGRGAVRRRARPAPRAAASGWRLPRGSIRCRRLAADWSGALRVRGGPRSPRSDDPPADDEPGGLLAAGLGGAPRRPRRRRAADPASSRGRRDVPAR